MTDYTYGNTKVSEARAMKGPFPVIECFQQIPCNPCEGICPSKAIVIGEDLNNTPAVDCELCTGCGQCMRRCPGLAIFMLDISKPEHMITIPYEYAALPAEGDIVIGLDRNSNALGEVEVAKVQKRTKASTTTVSVKGDASIIAEVRMISFDGGIV